MKIFTPVSITNQNLTSSSVAAVDADSVAYSAATTYAADALVIFNDPPNTVTMTIASPAVITWGGHEFVVGWFISFTTSGALPTGITSGKSYRIRKILTVDTVEISEIGSDVAIRTSGSQSGTHTATLQHHGKYRSLQAGNLAHSPRLAASSTWWQKVGESNRWNMFDGSVTSQTIDTSITVRITLPATTAGLCDTLVLMNVRGTQVVATCVVPGPITTYSSTTSLIAASWVSQTSSPATSKMQNLLLTGLPFMLAGGYVEITITDSDATLMCAIGAMLLGRATDVGSTLYGVSTGIQDFSVIEQDDFGNMTIVERAFSKKASFTIVVVTADTDKLTELLSSLRATPCVMIGNDARTCTVLYGLISDWSNVISYPTHSIFNIEGKGLT